MVSSGPSPQRAPHRARVIPDRCVRFQFDKRHRIALEQEGSAPSPRARTTNASTRPWTWLSKRSVWLRMMACFNYLSRKRYNLRSPSLPSLMSDQEQALRFHDHLGGQRRDTGEVSCCLQLMVSMLRVDLWPYDSSHVQGSLVSILRLGGTLPLPLYNHTGRRWDKLPSAAHRLGWRQQDSVPGDRLWQVGRCCALLKLTLCACTIFSRANASRCCRGAAARGRQLQADGHQVPERPAKGVVDAL